MGVPMPRLLRDVVAVIQHTSGEYLGLIEDHLEGRRIRFRYFRPFTEQGTIPQPGELSDGLVLLVGGPWGSAGDRNVPTLDDEITLTRAMLDQGKPVLGIGLGAQILARFLKHALHEFLLTQSRGGRGRGLFIRLGRRIL